MEKNGGWIKPPDYIIDALIQWKVNCWQYYENKQLLKAIAATMFFDNQEAKDFLRIHQKMTSIMTMAIC